MADLQRVMVSVKTQLRVKRAAKKQKVAMTAISDKIVLAGLKALNY